MSSLVVPFLVKREPWLNRTLPHEDMPWGRRWRLAGDYNSRNTITAGKRLTKGLPWFEDRGVYLHKMVRPDADRDLHCHPYTYVSLILAGGYCEYVRTRTGKIIPQWRRPGEWVDGPLDKFHRIDYLPTGECWTLFFTGKAEWMISNGERVHEWGFDVAGRFVPWTEYGRGVK